MKAIVIGIDGGIGRALGDALRATGHQVTGTTRRHENVDDRTSYLDLNNAASIGTYLPKADVVFFCAALTRYSECREDPKKALRVNAISPVAIATSFVERSTRVVLLSTSAVLDCSAPQMAADRPRRPASMYGRTKAEAESAFLALGPEASVLRLTKVLTPGMKRIYEWVRDLINGKSVRCPHDLRFSPITVGHVVQALIAISDQRQGGIFQVSGASDISYAEAAKRVADALKVSERLIEVCSAAELGIPPEEVTAYTSLDTARLNALCGFLAPDPWEIVDSIVVPIVASARSATQLSG